MRTARTFTAIATGILALVLTGSGAFAAPAHYIVFEIDGSGVPQPVFMRTVELPAVPPSAAEEQLEDARLQALAGAPLRVLRLEDDKSQVVHRSVVEIPRIIRGEFHGKAVPGGGWEIDSHRLPDEKPAFVARVPALPGTRLIVDGASRTSFDLDELSSRASTLRLAPMLDTLSAVTAFRGGGSPDNRVDLLIMGDGYTAAQQTTFSSAATSLENDFLSIQPYSLYRSFLNVTQLFTPSAQSGADHPPYNASCTGDDPSCCSDATMLGDPLAGTYVNTALGGRFCSFQIHRLVVVDSSAVLAAASAVPTWDQILVMVNDSTYGGSGGSIGVTSVHPGAVDIARHEFGHSFTDLADEYTSPFPGFPACSDISGPPCEANVTDETVLASIKWEPWIVPSTPIPTPPGASNIVGLFEGARYQSTGMYRPWDLCLMRLLGVDFGTVCKQEYILSLYRGGWGTPPAGIDLIEPGSEVPPIGPPVDGTGGVNFSVTLLQPLGAPPVDVQWYVDGLIQPAAAGSTSFAYAPPGPGTYQVEVRAIDVTPFVHPNLEGSTLTKTRTWTVQLASGPPGRTGDDMVMSKSTVTSGNIVLSWSPSCLPGAVDYGIFEGILGIYYSHKVLDCDDDGTPLIEDVSPAGFDAYYVVVPFNGVDEGSYGLDSFGAERPRVGTVCLTGQVITPCP